MSALVIWGEADHETRARALATTYSTTAEPVSTKPRKIKGLASLVFWGHGDAQHFCELTPREFVDKVSEWKKLNATLQTIEMLTCNARHKQFNYPDSYTERVVQLLGRKHADMKFKALPIAVSRSGKTAAFSILKWHPGSKTWAYVGAPLYTAGTTSQYDMLMSGAVVKLEDFMLPRGTANGWACAHAAMKAFTGMTVTHPYAVKRKWGQKEVDEYNVALTSVKDDAYILAGTLGMLRWALKDIKLG